MRFLKKIFIWLFLAVVATPIAIFLFYFVKEEFELSSIINYKPAVTTKVYDRNGDRIGNLFEEEHRYYAPFSEIPSRAVEALLAIEDTTFFEHTGINVDAILRAILKDIKAGKMAEGASTITQQLVKNTLLTREKKISRKIKEVLYSLKLEQQLTKEQILERYLNEIYFGHGYYGIKTAADGYFHKELNELTLKEIAILVGLPKAPSTYAPTKNYEISMGRANRVVSRMHELGWIDEDTYKRSLKENPKVYDDTLTQNSAPFVLDEIIRDAKKYGIEDIKTGGYKIYTTIDMKLQDAAQKALKESYDMAVDRANAKTKKRQKAVVIDETPVAEGNVTKEKSVLNGALVSIDSKSGDILAMVGGVDYKTSPYNRATQGRRQPGSAIKPFIYQVALDMGYSGATELIDISRTYTYEKDGQEQKWQPKNYEKNYEGLISLREALVHSRNLATINLVSDISLSVLTKEMKKFGFGDLPPNLSIALGTISLSPLEYARYFSAFANKGVQVEPNLVNYIEKGSSVVYEKKQKSTQIIHEAQVYLMTTILQDVVRNGTGKAAKVEGIEVAGKTGTTNSNVDAWFVGYSPTIETVIWFGNDDNTPMNSLETGGRIAAPAFSKYYGQIIKFYPQTPRKFDMPQGVREVTINGHKEYFTDVSKPPRKESEGSSEDTMLF